MSGFALRLAAELAFLCLLALALGLAELATPWIAVVMAIGWLLVVGVEWLAWRSETGARAPSEPTQPPPDESPAWDIDEILAPQPEAPDSTTVLPGDDDR